MTYEEYISQFEIFEHPQTKDGFHRHHIVPKSQQVEKDNRQVYLLPSQHLWAHILYDRENGTKTVTKLLAVSHIRKEDIHSYEDCLVYNDFAKEQSERASEYRKGRQLSTETKEKISRNNAHFWEGKHFSDETKEKISQSKKGWCPTDETRQRMSDARKGKEPPNKGKSHSDETKKKISESQMGEKNVWYGQHWYNNGEISVRAFECPEGFVKGRLRRTV